jgi:hypothetical protein
LIDRVASKPRDLGNDRGYRVVAHDDATMDWNSLTERFSEIGEGA